ncbi:MAG: hypothetical protein ACR2FN_07650 [Chitinophagaceae bacterium]
MKIIKIIAILISIFSIISCSKNANKPIAEDYIIKRDISFYIKDSSDNNLIGKNGQLYNPDSIQIYMPDNTKGKVILDSVNQYYCGIVYLLQMASKEEDINNFYIDLPIYVYLNDNDTDTIEVKKNFNQNIRFYYNNVFWDSIPALDKSIPILTFKK